MWLSSSYLHTSPPSLIPWLAPTAPPQPLPPSSPRRRRLRRHRALLHRAVWGRCPRRPRRRRHRRPGRAPSTPSSWTHASTCSAGWCMRSSARTRRTSAARWSKASRTWTPRCVSVRLLRPRRWTSTSFFLLRLSCSLTVASMCHRTTSAQLNY